MSGFRRDAQGRAALGGVSLEELLARSGVATPAYFYDLDSIRDAARAMQAAFRGAPHLLAYAMKANGAGSILRALAAEGLGVDVVSGGELNVALGAGVPADRIVMSGVAKTDAELDLAIGSRIWALQVESVEELARVAARARAASSRARVALRVNPSVEIDSHAHIQTGHDKAKFGIPAADVPAAFATIDSHAAALSCVGLSTHVGSMQAEPASYRRGAEVIASLARARQSANAELEYVNFGGGIGIDYGGAPCSPPSAFVAAGLEVMRGAGITDLRLVMEPGRALVGPAGVIVARVIQSKVSAHRRWLMLDAGMNDLMRPALYGARHRIEPLEREPGSLEWQIVGPVCESSDDFGAHPIGDTVPSLVAIRDAGAYGFSMASEYNGRALPAEVFVTNGQIVSISRSPGVADWARRRLEA